MMKFSNPRQVAEFDDYPSGHERVKCRFEVTWKPRYGFHVSRRTTNRKTGAWCAPKHTTYCDAACIVTGDDNKTYVLQYVKTYDMISIYRHDFMQDSTKETSASRRSDPERFDELMNLIMMANT